VARREDAASDVQFLRSPSGASIPEAPSVSRTLALTFVSQSRNWLKVTPKNVVIVVIFLLQQDLRMTTISRANDDSNQLLSPSTLANDDAQPGILVWEPEIGGTDHRARPALGHRRAPTHPILKGQ
jgi:hypothetical protein